MDDLTPWEEINPPMASAKQAVQPSEHSDWLLPADTATFAGELTACLALVAPVGMEEAARREWLQVAWDTLRHLPPDLLERGCRKARETCDHPSRIVPTVLRETEESMKYRRELPPISNTPRLPGPDKRHVLDRRGEPMSESDTFKLNGILEKLGATVRYRSDGSREPIQ